MPIESGTYRRTLHGACDDRLSNWFVRRGGNDMNNKPGLSTRCVHSGEMHDPQGSPHTPLYNTTTFAFGSTAELLDGVEGRKAGNLYTRYGLNPPIQSLEEKLAWIEGAEAAFAFSSGMAAEAALFLAHGQKGIVCIGDAYGGEPGIFGRYVPPP